MCPILFQYTEFVCQRVRPHTLKCIEPSHISVTLTAFVINFTCKSVSVSKLCNWLLKSRYLYIPIQTTHYWDSNFWLYAPTIAYNSHSLHYAPHPSTPATDYWKPVIYTSLYKQHITEIVIFDICPFLRIYPSHPPNYIGVSVCRFLRIFIIRSNHRV